MSLEKDNDLLNESYELKTRANALFSQAAYSDALSLYDRAISSLPSITDYIYETAVLRSNISACHIRLEQWKEAVRSATEATDSLADLDPVDLAASEPRRANNETSKSSSEASQRPQIELKESQTMGQPSNDDDLSRTRADRNTAEPDAPEQKDGHDTTADNEQDAKLKSEQRAKKCAERLAASGHTISEVQKLRSKILMRRAKARMEIGGWSSLQGSEEGKTPPFLFH